MEKLVKVLAGKEENYILPFLWIHGEGEETLRKYMQVIAQSFVKAVCIESRPHPDFCGEQWWHDMDIILDEAKKLDMKVWILDDRHFPTGFANGAMAMQPDERCRQSICCRVTCIEGEQELHLSAEEVAHPDAFLPTQIEMYIGEKEPRVFMDDCLVGIYAVRQEGAAERIILTSYAQANGLHWKAPKGMWKVYTLHLSRNQGFHRNYINMLDKSSCKVLLDSVYEPHYKRYREAFGTIIAGFFSDEPELGNGHLYGWENQFGTNIDFPWSSELEVALRKQLGEDFGAQLTLLWDEEAPDNEKAYVRHTYMDCVTRLVEEDFSYQIGNWCRERDIQYIGHLIEDNNQDSRTGSSLGHYFRGLAGQDMAGIDTIGGQVLPGGEDISYNKGTFAVRNGEFYHYMLGKLGNSLAVLDPLKQGNCVCEIFGNYGWSEGVQLEKYLVDHFLVRGINHYVPHAFSAKDFPDPDCPPHFYAHGHNPQYRHFGCLMAYTNRVCELISNGRSEVAVAILYHGEADWTGKFMYAHQVGHRLLDHQILYDYIPQDVFDQREKYKTHIACGRVTINTQSYKIVIVPYMQFVSKAFAEAIGELKKNQVEVIFVNDFPEGIYDAKAWEHKKLLENIRACKVISEQLLVDDVKSTGIVEVSISPANNRLRFYHYEHQDGSGIYLFVNEGSDVYEGDVFVKDERNAILYDAWTNKTHAASYDGARLAMKLEPLKSQILVLSRKKMEINEIVMHARDTKVTLKENWTRSICRSVEYPRFQDAKQVCLPDCLAEKQPDFSGFVRYETTFSDVAEGNMWLEITDAKEGVEVFINEHSLGIQIAPPYCYDLTKYLMKENKIVIEVATTLEREMAAQTIDRVTGKKIQAVSLSGITGLVHIWFDSKKSNYP